MIHIFSSFFCIFRPIAVFFIAFGIFGLGSLLIIRYGTLVASLSNKDILAADQLGNVLAENDNIEDILITFNYDTIFVRPVVFEQDITAPNVLYSLAAGSGLRVTGESQNPTITNTGVLSINGARGAVRFEAGDNITLTEEDGMIKITSSYIDTDTDTKLTEEEVERFVFDGENTGEFNGVKIGSISLDDPGVSSTTSGSSLIGVFGGNLSIIAGTNIQQIIESIDTNLSSVTDTSHAAVTLSGALDYLTLTGQQITLNQIDLTTDVSGILPIANGGTGAATISEARINLGIGTNNTVQFAGLSIGGTSPVITSILDEDDFASNSNTALPTQQSVKAYVDNEISGAALTYENGLTQTGSTVLLGGSLLQNTRLYSGSYEMLYLNTLDGNIGIGTTNPPAKLSVAAGSGAAEAFKVYRAATSLELFKVLENGTVTIGGTAADLNVGRNINATGGYVGSANYNTTYSGGYTHINASNNISVNIDSTNSSTTNYFAVYKDALSGNGSQLFRVQENGNVGIGTTNAGATLDVQGAAQFGSGNVDLINSTGKIVAINSTYFASVDGSALTNLNASNLSTGTVANGRISGVYTGITGTGTLNAGSITSGFGNINIGTSTFTGNGSGLTSLNASNLSSGTVPDARITGAYTGLTNLTGSGSSTFASFLLSSNGTAAAPAIRWSADTNMGIYRGGTDILRFSTAGADRLTINASGNVGIATTNPSQAKLVVNGGTGTGMHIVNTGDTALGLYVLNWDDGDGIIVESGGGDGITSFAAFGDAVYGEGDNGIHGGSYYGNAVYGQALTSSAWAGYFLAPGTVPVARFQNSNGTCDINPTSTTLSCSSDERLKKNISTIDNALDKIMALRGVNYNWKNDAADSPSKLGFIAQEVEQIFPELVHTDKETGYKQLASNNLIAVAVNAIQEQHSIVLTNKSNIARADIRLNESGEVLKIINAQTQKLLNDQHTILNQINLEKNIQNTKMASQSATLQDVQVRIDDIEKNTNDTKLELQDLKDRVAQLELLFGSGTATNAAILSEPEDSDILGAVSQMNAESLIVSGDTNLNSLGVTGDITAGLLSIKGFDDELGAPSASISTISGPLKLQDQATGNLEIMGGKILINTDGDIFVQGSITVEKINIDESNEEKRSIGVGKIPSGEDTVTIHTTSVTEKSKIFLTVQEILTPITIVEKTPGTSFTVKIGTTYDKEILFDWLILN